MKAESASLALRLGMALFLFSLTVAALYLMGAAQRFTDETLKTLYLVLRWLSWAGLLLTLVSLFPTVLRRRRHSVAAVVLGLGFLSLFAFVLVWGAWIYPEAGIGLW